jgi:hypothetical protein
LSNDKEVCPHTLAGVVDQRRGWSPAPERHLQSINHQFGAKMGFSDPSNDPP